MLHYRRKLIDGRIFHAHAPTKNLSACIRAFYFDEISDGGKKEKFALEMNADFVIISLRHSTKKKTALASFYFI